MIENCVIKSTILGKEDHGIPTCFLMLEGDGWGQGFGGYDLRDPGRAHAFIFELPRVLGASRWEALPGTLCWVDHDDAAGMARKIIRVGRIVDDRWFAAPG